VVFKKFEKIEILCVTTRSDCFVLTFCFNQFHTECRCFTQGVYIVSTFQNNQPVKLTKTVVDKAPIPDSGQSFIRDSLLKGFGLRITSTGTKSFIVEKRINGRVKRQTIGRFGELTTEEGRRHAQHLLGQIAIGRDPIAERRKKKAQTTTLEQAFEAFKQARKSLKPKTLRDYSRCMDREFANWKRKPITEITKHMVSRKHRELGESSGEAQANLAFRFLRGLLNFAKHTYEDGNGHSILPDNPVEILNHTRAWYKIDRRRTVIKPYQLADWYKAVQNLKAPGKRISSGVIADFLTFVLFTGLRFSEAAELKWSNVDLRDKTLTIPDPKNRIPFTLPLSNYVEAILLERHKLAMNDFVFPDRDGISHLVEPRKQILHVREESGIYFTVHDLRRTYITIAEILDISPYKLKRLLNHKAESVTEGYIISDAERLREPVQKIADFIVDATSASIPSQQLINGIGE